MSDLPTALDPSTRHEPMLEAAGRSVLAHVHAFRVRQRIERPIARDERRRLGRELHDGVLQSLAGAALQVQAAMQTVHGDPDAACARLAEIVDLLADQQREIRAWITAAESGSTPGILHREELVAALEKLRARVTWQYRLAVDLRVCGDAGLSRRLGDEVYRIVQEGLHNAGKHARGMRADVSVVLRHDGVSIRIADDGGGFPFQGRFRLADLARRRTGPVSLRGRVQALGGELVLTSSLSGSTLEIELPAER